MRIGIDARFYGPTGKGLGRYVERLVQHLELLPSKHTFVIFLRRENWDAYVPSSSRFHKALADFPWYSLQEQIFLPRVFAAAHCDLLHFPHYNVPLFYRAPFVITIHDLIVSRYPTRRASTRGPLPFILKRTAYELVIRSAIRRARAILTVSQYSKKELQEVYHVPEQKIMVTYEAAETLPPADPAANTRFLSLQPYLLYVGNAYPHKNIEGLLRAFALLLKETKEPLRLLLVGKLDYFYQHMQELARQLQIADSVTFTGYLTDAELHAAYANALLYVFPSFDEGFGLPPLEAMLAGVPVASSRFSCLPEILGDAAAYFDPHHEADMVRVLHRLVRAPEERAQLVERGAARVRRYNWETLARTTLDVYTAHASHG